MFRFSQLSRNPKLKQLIKDVLSQHKECSVIANAIEPSILAKKQRRRRIRASAMQPNRCESFDEHRKWHETNFGKSVALLRKEERQQLLDINGTAFTVMSYNILAQDLLTGHPQLYEKSNPRATCWPYRIKQLQAEIGFVDPHILCLQEVQENHLQSITQLLPAFDYIYKKRSGIQTDGCTIFYKRDIFRLVESKTIEYFRHGIEILNRENIAIILRLALHTHPKTEIVIATTHLLYNPRRQDVRLAQIQILLAELDRMAFCGGDRITNKGYLKASPTYLPVIVTGDFNLQPKSTPYELIVRGLLDYRHLQTKTMDRRHQNNSHYNSTTGLQLIPRHVGITDDCLHEEDVPDKLAKFCSGTLRHRLNLASVYWHQNEASTYHDDWINVDYIFYNKIFNPQIKSICEGYLKLLAKLSLPTIEQCREIGPIPNIMFGSDHFSLAAKFLLKHTPKRSKGIVS